MSKFKTNQGINHLIIAVPKVFNGSHSADNVLILVPRCLLVLRRIPQGPLLHVPVMIVSKQNRQGNLQFTYLLQLVDWSGDVSRKTELGCEGHVNTLVRNQGCVLDFVIRGRLHKLDLLLGF